MATDVYGPEPGLAASARSIAIHSTSTVSEQISTALSGDMTIAREEDSQATGCASTPGNAVTPIATCDDGCDKAFSTLRAELALCGFCLHRAAWGGFVITRWDLTRHEAELSGVDQFLRRVKP